MATYTHSDAYTKSRTRRSRAMQRDAMKLIEKSIIMLQRATR